MSDNKTVCKELIKDYCANCTFAGLHFIADDSKHWIERIVWVILVVLSWYGSALLIIAAWDAFVHSPISFGVETLYLDWDTKLPAVAICELANDEKRYNVSDTIWTENHLRDLESVLKEIVYYRGVSRDLVRFCFQRPKPDKNCPMSNYSYYSNLVRSDCPTILKNCSYNDNEFSCCEYFLPIETDVGTCFIINSVQTKEQNPYPMIKNMQNRQGDLKFHVTLTSAVLKLDKSGWVKDKILKKLNELEKSVYKSLVKIYTLGEDEVPTITTSQTMTLRVQPGHKYRRILSVRDIENDPRISETTREQRACRFPDENEESLYPKYSYSACTVLCRKRTQLEKCNCNDHFMLNTTESELCNITGMNCLNSLSQYLTTLKPSWAERPGLTCNCMPSCNDREISIISTTKVAELGHKAAAVVEIILGYLPTERFKRNVVRSRLDLVVSVGGTTGLFVGASILSFVELFFFFTVRLYNNLWMNRQKNKNKHIIVQPTDKFTRKYPQEFELRNMKTK